MYSRHLMTEIAATGERRTFYGYRLVGYSFAMAFLAASFFLHSRGIFFPYWMDEFGVDKTQVSLAISLTLFTGSCVAPLTGYLLDHFPVRRIVMIACAWLAIGYLLLRQVDAYVPFLLTLVLFQGIGWTGVGPLAQTKLMVNWFSRNRGVALGMAIMGISVAGIMMPTVAAFLAETFGWRDTYALYAAAAVMLMIPTTFLMVKQAPADVGQHPDGDAEPPEQHTVPQPAAGPADAGPAAPSTQPTASS